MLKKARIGLGILLVLAGIGFLIETITGGAHLEQATSLPVGYATILIGFFPACLFLLAGFILLILPGPAKLAEISERETT